MLFNNPAARLTFEIGQERASALLRQGQRLETALATLRAYDLHVRRKPPRGEAIASGRGSLPMPARRSGT
jgi:hypothetical protein